MQVAVSLVVDVPPDGDINVIETLVMAAGRQAMSEAMQASMREYEGRQKTCPHCGSDAIRSVGTDRRVLLMSFGRVVLTPRRLRCQHCKQRFRPADGFLACLGEANITASLAHTSVLAGTLFSYPATIKILESLCGVQLSAEQLRRLTLGNDMH